MPHGLLRYQCCIHAVLCSLRSLSLEIRVPPHWLITGLPIVEAIACLPPKLSLLLCTYIQHCQCLPALPYCQHVSTHPDAVGDSWSSCINYASRAGQGQGKGRAQQGTWSNVHGQTHTHTYTHFCLRLSHSHPQVDGGCEARGCHGATRQQGFAARLSNLGSTGLAR